MTTKKKKVLIAMSGGVDSSVAALLLLEQGYDLVGVTFRTYDSISESCIAKEKGCCTIESIIEAKHLAEKLGFEHHILDIRQEFESTIMANFIDEYRRGRTPNPCVLCNAFVKWGLLVEKANELDCNFLATGHYAQVEHKNGRYFLKKGKDTTKDQTYFLWKLTQENLANTLFPLGQMNKEEVRSLAKQHGFDNLAKKRESQEICFIPNNDYRQFLENEIDDFKQAFPSGDFVDKNGNYLGKHQGIPYYTIGQRKGLGVALGFPAYVLAIDNDKNQVILGNKDELFGNFCYIDEINMMKYATIPSDKLFTVRIRYRNQGVLARLEQTNEGLLCQFSVPIDAITPGQSAVFYEDDDLVGGGIIR